MVQIDYINGDSETVETLNSKNNQSFTYNHDIQMFSVFNNTHIEDCMMIPREFVKSIRHIEVE